MYGKFLTAALAAFADQDREEIRAALESLRLIGGGMSAIKEVVDLLRGIDSKLDSIRYDSGYLRGMVESMMLSDTLAADGRYADPKSLARYNRQMYSQQGEDGVIAEIFNRIGAGGKTFAEIGIGDGRENTTRFLLESGWSGTWFEGSKSNVAAAHEFMRDFVATGQLKIVQGFITAENVNDVFREAGISESVDYLSIDIDQNTSYVWQALSLRSRAACIEYNCTMPPNVPMAVPYDPEAVWDGSAWYGASLKTLENIGRSKNMALVGCDLPGINSYFVRTEEAEGKFREPFDANTHYEPPRYYPFGKQHRPPSAPRPWQVD